MGLWPGQRQAIIFTNAGILLIWTLGTNFSEILSKIYTFPFKKMHLKMSSAKRRPFCLSLDMLTVRHMPQESHYAGFSLLMLGIFHDSHHTWRVSVIPYDIEPFTVVQSDFKGYHSWVVFQTLQNNFDWCTQTYCQTSNISCTLVGNKNCWSLRCRWSIACRRCSNYIFIIDLTPGFNGLGKDNCKTSKKH